MILRWSIQSWTLSSSPETNQAGICITLSRKTNVHFKVIHDLSDASSTLTNDHGMYSWVNADLLVDHTLKLPNDLQDGIASFIGLLLVPGDGDDALLLGLLPWQLDLNIEVVPDLGDNGSSTADDLGMVFGIDLNPDLE